MQRKPKGMEIQGPMYLVSDGASGDPVTFETEFSMNPLYYCQIPNEENLLVCGEQPHSYGRFPHEFQYAA